MNPRRAETERGLTAAWAQCGYVEHERSNSPLLSL